MREDTDFSNKMEELDTITAWFESDKVDLTQALGKFERGMELVAELRQQLEEVENKVEKIKQRFDKVPLSEPAAGHDEVAPDLFQ